MTLFAPMFASPAQLQHLARHGGPWTRRPTAAVVFVALLGLCAASGCGSKGLFGKKGKKGDDPTSTTLQLAAKNAVKREFTVPVRATRLERREVKAYVSTIGAVAPIQAAPIIAEASGRLTFDRPWKPDDPVREAQVIARIDDRDLQAEISIAERNLSNAQSALTLDRAQLAKALQDLETTKELVARELQPRKDLDTAMIQIRSMQTAVEQSENNVRKAALDLERVKKKQETMILEAPIAGVLCSAEVIEKAQGRNPLVNSQDVTTFEGRMVSPGITVCGVIDLSKVVVRCDVTSKDIASVQVGAQAQARIYIGEENIEAQGQVAGISSVLNPDTRAFQVDVRLDNPDGRLHPGMFARVDIVTAIRRDAIAVPRGTLQKRNNLDVVFLAGDDGYSIMRAVKLGIENPDEIEVTEGLREGDRLIVMGHETLQDHVKVEVAEAESKDGKAAGSDKTAGKSGP
ncbi:MAG: efflux RND transporter periplasmic adaptor subunit [Candidatus Sumerlaeota bacterium]|nr:efflux RND transporter periplasmic adaptor subunit [Candidatus Sumerlaeota bacterium]